MLEVDDVVLEFSINARKPCFLFGKNRLQLVKVVSAKTAVRIFLPDFGSKEHEKLSSMTLEGSFDDVRRCVAKSIVMDVYYPFLSPQGC